MNKVDFAKLDVAISTIHLLNAAAESMGRIEHPKDMETLRAMSLRLTNEVMEYRKEGATP